jgi:hypothetical protein
MDCHVLPLHWSKVNVKFRTSTPGRSIVWDVEQSLIILRTSVEKFAEQPRKKNGTVDKTQYDHTSEKYYWSVCGWTPAVPETCHKSDEEQFSRSLVHEGPHYWTAQVSTYSRAQQCWLNKNFSRYWKSLTICRFSPSFNKYGIHVFFMHPSVKHIQMTLVWRLILMATNVTTITQTGLV